MIWCKQLGQTLEAFFAADVPTWRETCHLSEEALQKLVVAQAKLTGQAFLVEQLQHEGIQMMTVLDEQYPSLVKKFLNRNQIPPMLFYMGQLDILQRETIAIIGSRNASEASLAFTRTLAAYLAAQGANVISGYARGVDRTAYEGATGTDGCTTVVLPHGIHKLSKAQMRDLQPRIEAGNVLVLSQFHPDMPWMVSRAMERNHIVTGLAQIVIVAESDSKGGTWEGANHALKQGRKLYVRQTVAGESLPGNALLLEQGGVAVAWPVEHIEQAFAVLLHESETVQQKVQAMPVPPEQMSLFSAS